MPNKINKKFIKSHKKLIIIVASILLVASAIIAIISAGSGIPNENKILNDLKSYELKDIAHTNIVRVDIEKRQTNENVKLDNVFVKVTSNNKELEIISYYEVIYKYYDQGGWILEKARSYDKNKWRICPIGPPNDETIMDNHFYFHVDNGIRTQYSYSGKEDLDTKIDKIIRKDFDRKTDTSKVVVQITSSFAGSTFKKTGSVVINYMFKDGEWKIDEDGVLLENDLDLTFSINDVEDKIKGVWENPSAAMSYRSLIKLDINSFNLNGEIIGQAEAWSEVKNLSSIRPTILQERTFDIKVESAFLNNKSLNLELIGKQPYHDGTESVKYYIELTDNKLFLMCHGCWSVDPIELKK